MIANNAFERTGRHGGPRLAAAQRWWLATQLGRYDRTMVPALISPSQLSRTR